MTTVTDAEGNYRLRDLPAPGVYRVVFELAGFQTIALRGRQPDRRLHRTGLMRAMKVSTVSETVEVSGQSPVVDTVSVAGVSSIQHGRVSNPSRSDWASRTCSRWPRASVCRAP